MRTLTYYVATSLDGFIADPDGGYDAFSFEGDLAEHICSEYADTLPGHAHQALGVAPSGTRYDTVLMGWNTYAPALDLGITSPYPHLRQYVATRRTETPDAPDVGFTADPVGLVRGLRGEPGGGIWLAGGGTLAAALVDEIDELVLKVNPILLGGGIPLFRQAGAAAVRRFRLDSARTFDCGVALLRLPRRRD